MHTNSWTPSVGVHTLEAIPFSEDQAGGAYGSSYQIEFEVVDQP